MSASPSAALAKLTWMLCLPLQHVLRTSLFHDSLARGLRECVKALDRREAHLCVLSSSFTDEAEGIPKLITALCNEHSIPMIKVPDSKKLGEWVGLCKYNQEGKAVKVRTAWLLLCCRWLAVCWLGLGAHVGATRATSACSWHGSLCWSAATEVSSAPSGRVLLVRCGQELGRGVRCAPHHPGAPQGPVSFRSQTECRYKESKRKLPCCSCVLEA